MARILIVEDQPMLRYAAVARFKDCGHEVTACADYNETIAALRAQRQPVDLLLTDWQYPGKENGSKSGGLELLRHLKIVAEINPEQLPKNVVVMSADPELARVGVVLSGFESPLPPVFLKDYLNRTLFQPVMEKLLP